MFIQIDKNKKTTKYLLLELNIFAQNTVFKLKNKQKKPPSVLMWIIANVVTTVC